MSHAKHALLLGLCLLALGLAPAHATGDLFTEQVEVSDEAAVTRNAALGRMLEQVLIRVSGNPAIAAQPAATEILQAAPNLVQQYRYRSVEQGGQLVRYLWARFDQPAVERLMRERGLPVWVQRPEVLVWLGVERSGQRELLALEQQPAARDRMLTRAAERGLPLQLPLMDLEDQAALLPADLWSDYRDAIMAASARYPHDRVLAGRLTDVGNGRWRGAWRLLGPADGETFQTTPAPLDETLRQAVDQVQNRLAARYAPTPGGAASAGVFVRFAGVQSLPDYAALLGVLENLEPVRGLALRSVDRDDLVFEFDLRTDTQNLIRALEGSGRLVSEPLTAPVALPAVAPAPAADAAMAGPGPAPAPPVDYAFRLLN
jgi:hypothetical protein